MFSSISYLGCGRYRLMHQTVRSIVFFRTRCLQHRRTISPSCISIKSSPVEANSSCSITTRNKKILGPVELSQIYELFHFEAFSDSEIEDATDNILQIEKLPSPSSNALVDESSSSSDRTETSHSFEGIDKSIDIVTPEKVSLLLQTRMRQHLERARRTELHQTSVYGPKDSTGAFDLSQGFPATLINIKGDQQWDNRILRYSDVMATRLLYHLISQHNIRPTNELVDSLHVTKLQFIQGLKAITTNIDYQRVLPISLSMILVGTSVGIIVPLMPFIVEQLSITPGDYGVVVSAFALSKFLGNLPSAILVDRHGRKPYMVYSLTLLALGVGGIGVATTLDHLIACRLIAGFGVAALSTAATLTISDISTPRNRAATMAPMNSGFAAGMALGPAIGGLMGDYIGVSKTFFAVGASYLGVAALNSALLCETKTERSNPRQWIIDIVGNEKPTEEEQNNEELKKSKQNSAAPKQPTAFTAIQDAVGQWIPLLSIPTVKTTVIINGCYWVALSGAQMTLLPLMLTNPAGLALSASSLGKMYMGMSVVQVFGNPSIARIVDRVGKVPSIIGGCTAISAAMFAVPYCTDTYQLAAALGCWSLGSTTLSTAPVAYMVDQVPPEKRAQALVLLRTAGDIGFLCGAIGAGAVATWTGSMDLAMQGCSAFLLTATFWYTNRRRDK